MKLWTKKVSCIAVAAAVAVVSAGCTRNAVKQESSDVDSFHAKRGWFRKTHLYLLPYTRVTDVRPDVLPNDMQEIINLMNRSVEQCWYYTESSQPFDLKNIDSQISAFESAVQIGTGGYVSNFELLDSIKSDTRLKDLHSRYSDASNTIARSLVHGAAGTVTGVTTVSGVAAVLSVVGAKSLVATAGTILGLKLVTAGTMSGLGLAAVGVSSLCGPLAPACLVGAAVGAAAVIGTAAYTASKVVLNDKDERINDPVRMAQLKEALSKVSRVSELQPREMSALLNHVEKLSNSSMGARCPSREEVLQELHKIKASTVAVAPVVVPSAAPGSAATDPAVVPPPASAPVGN